MGQCEFFRTSAEKYGREYDPAKVGWLAHAYVADSDEQAAEEFFPHAAYQMTLGRGFSGPDKAFFPPGSLPPDKVAAWERQVRHEVQSEVVPGEDEMAASANLPIVGTPETVTERLIDRLKDYKIGNVAMAFQMGTLPHEQATRSMRLFAEQVMPVVRREIDQYLDGLYPNRTQSEFTLRSAAK